MQANTWNKIGPTDFYVFFDIAGNIYIQDVRENQVQLRMEKDGIRVTPWNIEGSPYMVVK